MKNKMVKYPVILGTIALVAGLLLALVYNITEPIIENNKVKRENAIVLEIFGDDVEIDDRSESLSDDDKEKGIYSALVVESENSVYYVYKITTSDNYDGDESSYVLVLNSNGEISNLRFTKTGDDFASGYASSNYENRIKGKNSLTITSDKVTGSTKTGEPIIEAINGAIAHYGRNK